MGAEKKERAEPLVLDPSSARGELKALGGSMSDDWNNVLVHQATNALWLNNSDKVSRSLQLNATLFGLLGIDPKDELEGMMAAQLLAAHNAAMECYRRAMIGEQSFEGRKENLNQANKLSRTYTTLLEALDKHRGKGHQKVTVEHVHVHSGGQAVVGVVERPNDSAPPGAPHPAHPGGGERLKTEEQPHAKQLAHAPQPAMWGADAAWDFVPIPRVGER